MMIAKMHWHGRVMKRIIILIFNGEHPKRVFPRLHSAMNESIFTSITTVFISASLFTVSLIQAGESQTIPWPEVGKRAGEQYTGDGLQVTPLSNGEASLRCVFQKLEGRTTAHGLWLTSTAEAGQTEKFRVMATAMGRKGLPLTSLGEEGRIIAAGDKASFLRPGVVEEYSVSMDGVRQDFLVLQRPAGGGALCLQLSLDGAAAQNSSTGVEITLPVSLRKIAYSSLKVTDAEGKVLPARMEVDDLAKLRIEVEDSGAAYPLRLDPTFSDSDWVSLGAYDSFKGYSAFGNRIRAMAVTNEYLYVGGEFESVSDVYAHNVARWDGNTWATLGEGATSGVNNIILALAAEGDDVYVGGIFTEAGGQAAGLVAKWDGTSWSNMDGGIVGSQVSSLQVSGGTLYAGGDFSSAGGTSASHVARWNGNSWSAMGAGSSSRVLDLAMVGGNLYATGTFSGMSAIAQWTGSAWNRISNGVFSSSNGVLAVSGNDLYAYGTLILPEGPRSGIAVWNGGSWSVVATKPSGTINCMAVYQSVLYIGGEFLTSTGGNGNQNVAKWNGTTWTTVGGGVNDTVFAMAMFDSKLIIGGAFVSAGGESIDSVVSWDGSAFQALDTAPNGEVSAIAVHNSELIAAGSFTRGIGKTVRNIIRWNGTSWAAMGEGLNSNVNALAVCNGVLYAGGRFTMSGSTTVSYIARWDGTRWQPVGSGLDDFVWCMAVMGSDLYVGGEFSNAGSLSVNRVARWDGSTWSALGSGVSLDALCMAVTGSTLYVGGNFTQAGGKAASRIAKWSGGAWSAMGAGFGSRVRAIAASPSSIYVGGDFTLSGTTAISRVAKWNGASWESVGAGLDNRVRALTLDGGILYAGGDFLNAGGSPFRCIARWNGTDWTPMGSGIGLHGLNANPSVAALLIHGAGMYVGGSFEMAGRVIASNIARAAISTAQDISLEQPLGDVLQDGETRNFGQHVISSPTSLTFTLRNLGSELLTGVALSLEGSGQNQFALSTYPSSSISGPNGVSTFTITFTPSSVGLKTATLHIASNDPDENPFDIILTGTGTAPPPAVPPVVKTLAATGVSHDSAVLNGSVNAKGSERAVFFDHGLSTVYGSTVPASPTTVNGSTDTAVSATISGLLPHTKYHFRARATGSLGSASGIGLTFTTLNRKPAAVLDSFSVLPGATVVLPVMVNDTDPDGDALSIASNTVLVPASAGKLTKTGNTLAFAAAAGFAGATFNYMVKDAFGGLSGSAVVSLTLGSCSILPTQAGPGPVPVTYPVTVTADGAWSVIESLPWASAVPLSGTGNGIVQVMLQANTGMAQRTGSLFIGGVEHRITQAGVSAPSLSQPLVIPPAAVGAAFQMTIPTQNLPVVYTVTNLPPGLKLDGNTGLLSGKPTKGGSYAMTVKAKNAAGTAEAILSFTLAVSDLHEHLIGAFQGLVRGQTDINGQMGSRLEIATTSAGGLSGKLITGTMALPFRGVIEADVNDQDHPEALISVPRGKSAPLSLNLAFDRDTQSLTGQVSDGPQKTAVVRGWRNPWSAKNKVPAYYRKLHTFVLEQTSSGADLPQGYGFGSFPIVAESTGAVVLGGRLADGSPFSSSCFLGRNGELLLYSSLYANRGSLAGWLTVTPHDAAVPDNALNGAPAWFKPGPLLNSKDRIYTAGFGPATLIASGEAYPVLAPGGLLLGLTSIAPNAVLEFTEGGLDTEGKEFSQNLTLSNLSATGLTQKATFTAPISNGLKLTALNSANGTFSGEFSLAGASTATTRKTIYQGLIVKRGSLIRGYGYFLLPVSSTAAATQKSGAVLFKASQP